jgi:hypothetical protein
MTAPGFDRADGRYDCQRCSVAYDPRLVDGRCPVCGTPAPGIEARPTGAPDKAVLLVGLATGANFALLVLLAILLLR